MARVMATRKGTNENAAPRSKDVEEENVERSLLPMTPYYVVWLHFSGTSQMSILSRGLLTKRDQKVWTKSVQ